MTELEFIDAFNRPWFHSKDESEPYDKATKPAAVLIAINPGDQHEVIFTTRASHLKHHPGQISFPGGKAEEHDINLAETAKREAHEEIGLAPALVEIIGAMPNYRTISGFSVTPIVAKLSRRVLLDTELELDFNEVDDVFSVPLKYLLEMDNYYIHERTRGNVTYPVYFIKYQDKTIWGATAGMLSRLALHINNRHTNL